MRSKISIPGNRDADPEIAKRFRARAAIAERRGVFKTLGSITFRMRKLVACMRPDSGHAKFVNSLTGKSMLQQVIERMLLLVFCRFEPEAYYMLGLFDPERFSRAGDFISFRQYVNINHYILDKSRATLEIVNDKERFARFCAERSINTPAVIARLDPQSHEAGLIEQTLAPYGEVFFKPNDGGCGVGAGMLTYQPDGQWRIRAGDLDLSDLDWVHVLRMLCEQGSDLIVQPVVKNHTALSLFGDHALHTVRITTVKLHDKITPLHAALRTAGKESVVDNYIAGGMAVAIDVKDGTLGYGAKKAAESLPASASSLDTGAEFLGQVLPCWNGVLELAINVHTHLSEFASLGHDIAITPDGASLIEVNPMWDGGVFQKTYDIGLISTPFSEFVEEWFEK